MEKESFEIVNKTVNDQLVNLSSSSASSFFECSHPSFREKKLEFSNAAIDKPSAVIAECGESPVSIVDKLSNLLEQTSELKEKFKSRNEIIRNEIIHMNVKQKELFKENRELRQKKGNKEAVLSSDDDSDYFVIIPSENALQKKADESILFQNTLLQLHDLSNNHAKLVQELAEERLKAENLSKLLDEKDEQNQLLKQFFESAKFQMLNNIQLQSELDTMKKELKDMKSKMIELHKKCEESNREVEDYKIKLEKLEASDTDIINSLQAEKKLLQESLGTAKQIQGFDRTYLTLVEQKLENASEENKDMVELLSCLKVENEQLKRERDIKEREYQEHLDDLTAKLVNTEQKLERVQIKLSLNIRTHNSSTANSSLTNLDDSDGHPLSDERREETSVKKTEEKELEGFRCPYCFLNFSSSFNDIEDHMLNCCDMYV